MDYEFLWAAIRFNSTDSNKTWIFIFLDVTISHKPNSKQQEPILSQQQPTYTYVIQKMSKQNCHVTCLLQWAWTKQSAFSNFYFSFNFAFQFLVKSTEKKKNASKAPFYFTFSHNGIRDLSVCVCLCVVYTRITVMAHSFRLRLLLCDQCVTRVAPIQFFSISKKTRQFNLFPFRRKESTWNEAPRRMHRNRWNFSITIAYLVEKIHTLTM